jgi:hypothetical protein
MRRLALLALVALAAGCGGGSQSASTPPKFIVGAVEDAAKWANPTTKMALAQQANYGAIVLSAVWSPPLTQPPPNELNALRGAVDAATAAGIRPIVAVYFFNPATPLTPAARAQFASYAASIPREIPNVHDVSVGNEPNLNLFWLPQFAADGSDAAAPAYVTLLAESYDALKKVSPDINVIGGSLASRGSDNPKASRQTQSPTRFIEDMGAAYRASGRDKPLMDMFSLHPYPENSSIPPSFVHPHSTTMGLADYDKLVALLGTAFDGTAQPGSTLPIAYGEYGLQTQIPADKTSIYTGAEQPAVHAIDEQQQAGAYGDAIAIAACDPNVRMLLFFHVTDEPQLERLQTGVFYADDTPKSSLEQVADAAKRARDGDIGCK